MQRASGQSRHCTHGCCRFVEREPFARDRCCPDVSVCAGFHRFKASMQVHNQNGMYQDLAKFLTCNSAVKRHWRNAVCTANRRLYAPVAQLDRALPSEGRGHKFESCRVRHKINDLADRQSDLSNIRRIRLARIAPDAGGFGAWRRADRFRRLARSSRPAKGCRGGGG